VAEQGEGSHELLQLAEQLRAALRPQSPSSAFRQRLRQDLIQMAEQRMHRDVRIASSAPAKSWIIGAAIGSAMALAGGIAYLLHSHNQTSQQSGQVRT